jgi:hypothetical protein
VRQADPNLPFQLAIAIWAALIVVFFIASLNHKVPYGLFADRDPEIADSFKRIK